ncbi:CHC2 zinc finger domain-containing protein [Phascolarctobacterium faecium]|mgnify:FL=1|uniref:CHC2 zinc finger domain-containing protein n=1 Tax=Phascolarctobacterium faecium TaxID=33025 RepID=UPI003522E6DE
MSGMFDDFKEQVRSQANIVEIISEYVPLKKRGGSFWGCCPFHGEKNTVLFRNAGQELFLLLWLSCWR